jgi:hypothetical protein
MGNSYSSTSTVPQSVPVAYNEDGFSSLNRTSVDRNGFIMSINEDGSCGTLFDRTEREFRVENHPSYGPIFFDDLLITNNCNVNYYSHSILGSAYGEGADRNALFGQFQFRVSDYEVFKVVIE